MGQTMNEREEMTEQLLDGRQALEAVDANTGLRLKQKMTQVLAINEILLGANHPDTARSLHELAEIYYTQEKYEEAEPLYKRALAINEAALGADHPNTAISLHNLANLYYAQGKY